MTIGVAAFRGKRLKEARLARGLFKNALADMIGVSGTAIGRYEDGLDKPQQERLDAIADRLNFPVSFFMQPEWPEQPALVFWRSRSAETKYAREMTEQRMIWLCEVYNFLTQEVDFPRIDLPPPELPSNFRQITPDLIERAAEDLRDHWKLRDQPIPDMTLALENAGIPVVNLEIASDKQDGFCFRSERLQRLFVGINTYEVSAARARYDAAHELGHLVLHQNVTPQQAREPLLHKLLEQQAFRFAGAFLFPKSAFRREVRTPSLDYFSALKKRWGISIAAMAYRAHNLGLIDDAERSVLYRNMARRRWRGALQEPFDDPSEMPLERPRMLRRGLEVVLEESCAHRSDIARNLALPERELEQIVGVDRGYFRTGETIQLAVPKRQRLKAFDMETGTIVEFPSRVRRG